MTSYEDHEKEYYAVIAMPSGRALELVDHIIAALGQRRMRLPLLTLIHWLPDRWQCLTELGDMEHFHALFEADATHTSRRLDRIDFSAELGDNERHYHHAMSLLDFLDVRLFCSYIVRTTGVVRINERPRGVMGALAEFFGIEARTCAVHEYRIVVDFPLTLSMRRETALQLATATRYQPPAVSASEVTTVSMGRVPSVSESMNVRSTMSGHSGRSTSQTSLSLSLSHSRPTPSVCATSRPVTPSSSSSSSSSSTMDAESDDEGAVPSAPLPTPPTARAPSPVRGVIKVALKAKRRDDASSSSGGSLTHAKKMSY